MSIQYTMLKAVISIIILDSLLFALSSLRVENVHAATVSNDNFQIEIDELNEQPQEQLPPPVQTQTPQQEQSSPGIAFIPSPFSFSVSEPLLDFGILSATNPVTRATTLTVASPGSGYQVFAFANHTLRSKTNVSIPDTTCDNGSCSEITASLWENNLTYGFGFRCDSLTQSICPPGFEEKQAYKQYSDHSKKESLQPILQNAARTEQDEARITYKVNISGTQQKEAYNNIITYIAVPNF